jgi:putative acyl-CoA dehydrogenase
MAVHTTVFSAPPTHRVENQPPALQNYNLYLSDPALVAACGRSRTAARLEEFGALMGSEDLIRAGFQANENPPVLKTHDRFGHRIDEVEFHPAYHTLMRHSLEFGLHSLPWVEPRPGAHVARIALMYLASQNEAGHTCPVSMTYSAVPALRKQREVAAEWEPRIFRQAYDARCLPAGEKAGVTIGMAMTEKQGGSDVRANSTVAEPIGNCEYRITGHKWFCSAPMSDAFLVLAQAPGGLTCFLLPRWTPDGKRNDFHLQRLKSKLGNRSNASAEVEFQSAWAQRIGDEGRGVPTIIEMVQDTRMDCVMGSAALMRQALLQAIHHARHRSAFGRLLIDQPLMQNVLADLAIESEAAMLLMIRLAEAFDRGDGLARLATAVAKYWVCKRGPQVVTEALECHGGNGYVEESILPRLMRESPLNSIWEGSGNVICLDVLRAIGKDPESLEHVLAEIELARGSSHILDRWMENLGAPEEERARLYTERLALALQASLMIRFAQPEAADLFLRSRLGGDGGRIFGTLPPGAHLRKVVEESFEG